MLKKTLKIGERTDGTDINIPYIEFGHGDSPKIFLGFSVHGNELTALGTAWLLVDYLRTGSPKGTIKLVPGINVEGINYYTRGLPYSLTDLNRIYPGEKSGSLGQRITSLIWHLCKDCDYVIDVHCAGYCIPFILIDSVEDKLLDKIISLANSSGVSVVHEYEKDRYYLEHLEGSLSAVALKNKKIGFTLELKSVLGIDKDSSYIGYQALKNILIYLNFIADKPESLNKVIHIPPSYRRKTVYAERGGLIDYKTEPGAFVRENKLIADIRNHFGDIIDRIVIPTDGYILALSTEPVVSTGGLVAEIAVKKHAKLPH
mgnify:CR=1 FL=1